MRSRMIGTGTSLPGEGTHIGQALYGCPLNCVVWRDVAMTQYASPG